MARFSFDPHGNRGGRRKLMYASILAVVVLGLDIVSGGAVRSVVQRASAGIWSVGTSARTSVSESGLLATRASLAKENAGLREQLSTYTQKAAAYESVKQENEILRSLLSLSQASTGITAPIVSSVRSSPYGTFLVRAGVSDGVTVGSVVITQGGFVVGVISDVGSETSTVREVFAGGDSIDAQLAGAVAAAKGRGGGNAVVEMPRGVEVHVGDVASAPTLGGRPIGVVGNIEAESSSASQTVYMNLPVNLLSLKYVYIVAAR